MKTIGGANLRRRNERDQGLTVTGRVGPSPLVSLKWLRKWLRLSAEANLSAPVRRRARRVTLGPLADTLAPHLRVYARETAIAEKVAEMVQLGMADSGSRSLS